MKKYYELEERVFLTELKKSAIVKALNPEEREATVSYFNGKDENDKPIFVEANVKFWNISKFKPKDEIIFAKIRPDAVIPSKKYEDGCYDLYACFSEDYIEIKPGELKMIPTGIASAFAPKYRASIRERGSSGSKGLARRCGEVDSGYRDEWFVYINNTSNKTIFIAKKEVADRMGEGMCATIYPYEKALTQVAFEYVPNLRVREKTYEELLQIPSERGLGKLGSSGK
jgi:dUTP pyrophosphatase